MILEAAWKAVHLTLILYLSLQHYGQEANLNQKSGSV